MFKTPQIDGYTPTLDEVVKKLVTGDSKDAASLAAGTFAVGTSLLATVLKRRFQDKKQ